MSKPAGAPSTIATSSGPWDSPAVRKRNMRFVLLETASESARSPIQPELLRGWKRVSARLKRQGHLMRSDKDHQILTSIGVANAAEEPAQPRNRLQIWKSRDLLAALQSIDPSHHQGLPVMQQNVTF